MNRLVIVGNGFDLAHRLPTGYCDFIDWYWNTVIQELKVVENISFKDEFIEVQIRIKNNHRARAVNEYKNVENYADLKDFIQRYSEVYNPIFPEENYDRCYMQFSNKFYDTICNKRSVYNWVDIENEYYKLLKECLEESDNTSVTKLNQEFGQVKNLLEDYLIKNVEHRYDFSQPNDKFQEILSLFVLKPLNLAQDPDHPYFKEFPKKDYDYLIDFDNQLKESNLTFNIQSDLRNRKVVQDNFILNFNYTSTFDRYYNRMYSGDTRNAFGEPFLNQIHGRLQHSSNHINFGFGDEMDGRYKEIENKDDNEYLRNIKSFQYLQNDNYKTMLNFIDGNYFQVWIMGHSCGLSDRILLNRIFEHKNCRSIKVFYHKFDKPKSDGREDNYTEIIQNISRHFNQKEMMREKIVNKSLCQPLPQNVRFELK